tara:strand:+ start:369 stop:821 length:453 start_codon:yes stop_codon:yes gene_type:complete
MNLQFLNSKQIKHLKSLLESQFGYTDDLDYVVVKTNKNKLYLANKSINEIDLTKLRINSMGVYFGELLETNELRLSIEGSQIIGRKANKNIYELNDEQIKDWFKGIDLEIEDERNAFVIIKYNEDFCGCGKIKNKKLLNYVGKVRRVNLF